MVGVKSRAGGVHVEDGTGRGIDLDDIEAEKDVTARTEVRGSPQYECTELPAQRVADVAVANVAAGRDVVVAGRDVHITHMIAAPTLPTRRGASVPSELDLGAASALLRPYFDLLRSRLADTNALTRTVASELHGTIQIGETEEDGLDLDNGEVIFVSGWSGRGKSTVLQVLARRAMRSTEKGRFPIFLRADAVRHTVAGSILDTLTQVTEAFRSEVELALWLSQQPTLLLIDDWHRASDSARRTIGEFLGTLRPGKMAVALAGAPTVLPPPTPRLYRIEMGRYSVEERNAIIRGSFGQVSGTGAWVVETLPDGLDELLREPIILTNFFDWSASIRQALSCLTTFPNSWTLCFSSCSRRAMPTYGVGSAKFPKYVCSSRGLQGSSACRQLPRRPGVAD
jgi:hypothetical protein